MEYMSMGSIVCLIEKQGRFCESQIQNYTYQILKGLSYLHSKKIVHKDLKG
jgi:serine/threonine protein kinase